MGTNIACIYVTLYYSYHKETQLVYIPYIKYYSRLINDAFIIVDKNVPFEHLESNMNNFGPSGKNAQPGTQSRYLIQFTS